MYGMMICWIADRVPVEFVKPMIHKIILTIGNYGHELRVPRHALLTKYATGYRPACLSYRIMHRRFNVCEIYRRDRTQKLNCNVVGEKLVAS